MKPASFAKCRNDTLRVYSLGVLWFSFNLTLDNQISATEKKETKVITRKNEDGSTTYIFESWEELLNQEPKWQPDADLKMKDRMDERIWGY